jgi:hypothetical protein
MTLPDWGPVSPLGSGMLRSTTSGSEANNNGRNAVIFPSVKQPDNAA